MRKRKTARPTLRRNITKTEEYIFGLCVIRVIIVHIRSSEREIIVIGDSCGRSVVIIIEVTEIVEIVIVKIIVI